MTLPGPVSAALEADLRAAIRRHGVVLWLDLDGHYTAFVDGLAAPGAPPLPYAVHAFRGSHLALMLALEPLAGGVDRTPLVVHLPGFNEESVRATPLFELYAAGTRYRKKLETLVIEAATGRVHPDQIAAFQAAGGLTLARADDWLASFVDDAEGGLAVQLRAKGLPAVVDDLLAGGFVAGRVRAPEGREALWAQVAVWTGLPPAWRDAALPPHDARPSDVAFAIASWALAVEYVHDLSRPPTSVRLAAAVELPGGVVEACASLARHLRERQPTFYQRTADETEGWLTDEVAAARASDLGRIDTFRFEEERVLQAALAGLDAEQWSEVLAWSAPRRDGGSFWLRDDPARRNAWTLVHDAARLGKALEAAGAKLGAGSLEAAIARYQQVGAEVDRRHRLLEQRRAALLFPQVPEYETLRARLDLLRRNWRGWADEWARGFNAICARDGFLPPAPLQQRTLFDDVVRPSTQEAGKTAYFVVDALRYELAESLYDVVRGTPATTARLDARLAELPTVTEVGMNALAPVARNGRLRPHLQGDRVDGFQTGEFRVNTPETRRRAMHDRVGGATCPWLSLAEVLADDTTTLKQRIGQARLVVVHSLEIDQAGESGAGLAVFDTVMQQLRAAWHLLREAGVRRFVITADHGFLLLDDTVISAQTHGRKIDPHRRHVLTTDAADRLNEARVPLADLGYEGADGLHVVFPDSTGIFDIGRRGASFVHGGNSLQERVIPVLTIVHRAAAGSDSLSYVVRAEAGEGVAGMHRLAGRVEVVDQGGLAFGGNREVTLGLRVSDDPDVQVELCSAHGGATLDGGALRAVADAPFELFFKLAGPIDARVQVHLLHLDGVLDVQGCRIERRFTVVGTREADGGAAPIGRDWLDAIDDPGVRQLFEHLQAHGVVTESEAVRMLGSPRAARRFAGQFEAHAARAPFTVRIDATGPIKRYVRDGGN